MKRSTKSKVQIITVVFIVLFFLIYALFNSRLLITGPQIEVFGPENGSSFTEPLIHLTGKVKNASFTSLNDNPILIDEEGNFGQKLLLSPGPSIIKLVARDRFGREIQKILQYVYTGETIGPNENSLEIQKSEVSTTTSTTTSSIIE